MKSGLIAPGKLLNEDFGSNNNTNSPINSINQSLSTIAWFLELYDFLTNLITKMTLK